jgi:hypothetical protein
MFHVKHFGTIDALRRCAFAKRRDVRCGDLGQARFCYRFKLWLCDFLKSFRAGRPPSTLPEHFQAKWVPVRVKKMRPNKDLRALSDSMQSESALAVDGQGATALVAV